MPALIYAPEIRIYVDTEHNGIVDVSEDNVDGSLTRRSDGVSVVNFSLQNPRRKYDSVFTPNDRVIIMMKRVAWLRVFTGYLNSVPLVTAWPRVVPLAASCSLKRLQYWYWDAYTAESQQLIMNSLAKNPGSDGGVTNVILNLLDKVVGWDPSKVHIARIPEDWFKIAEKIAADVAEGAQQASEIAQQYMDMVGANGFAAGQPIGNMSVGLLTSGKYGDNIFTSEQLGNAQVIYNEAVSQGLSLDDAIIGLMTAMQESGLKNLDYGDRDSIGLFQQRAGWGTKAERLDPQYASKKFFWSLKKITNRANMTKTQAAQAVQRSGFPDAYAKWETSATSIAAAMSTNSGAAGLGSDGTFKANSKRLTTSLPQEGTQGTSTYEAFTSVAIKLVHDHPNIRYYASSDTAQLKKAVPDFLDCSSFVRWCYTHTLGSVYDMPRTAADQYAWCRQSGRTLTVAQALKTPGALLFVGGSNNGRTEGIHHVEMSVGDGQNTVGAHHTGSPASVQPAKYNRWTHAGLPPRISFDGAIGTSSGSVGNSLNNGSATSGPTAGSVAVSTTPGFNPQNKIDSLFGNVAWAPLPSDEGQVALAGSLVGMRALLNDQPILPYLKNLFNSTMRSFCSAPNGDLIAWFPDYYGLWGTAAKLVIEPIELKDFSVEWADDSFVTHQFALASSAPQLDIGSGNVGDVGADANAARVVATLGIATIDIAPIMWALFGIEANDQDARNFAAWIYKRFGARPDYQPIEGITGPKAEFFSALFLFMRQWAYQYNADVPLTFMPEAWPGMLVQIPAFNFQAYITTVTHSWRFGEGGSFNTTLNIAAPARMPHKKGTNSDHVLLGLPLAGGYAPGRGIGNTETTFGAAEEAARQGALNKVRANNAGLGF